MKFFTLLLSSFLSIYAFSQNVGIGTTNPGEKLDVNGNINVTGTIKTNGTDGTAGQILMKNSSGSLVWGDMSEFRNLATFITPGSSTWTVPAGVTRIWVEAWGGGAGGNYYGSGAGGGYISGILTVIPGTSVSYTVGTAGLAGTTSSTAGGNSQIGYSTTTLTANGGAPSNLATLTGVMTPGAGGSFTVSGAGFNSFIGFQGKPGTTLLPTSYQYNATTFIESCIGGDGGDAANTEKTGGKGGSFLYNTTTGNALRLILPTAGLAPGGGGGSGFISIVTLVSVGNNPGTNGGQGRVIIHY